ncbi:hypothetical protein [Streptomyces sp. G-5]|uniref:hypothetical protein n=1 Tax=Streptomyces sp. G-5 TaxID=2977231 RepID=UPI0021D1CAA3|nr:hypothetical protein [Streptomyces sp. G-5]MCU4750224.1 hypothetical protein [Streptomyces sp. G-5]
MSDPIPAPSNLPAPVAEDDAEAALNALLDKIGLLVEILDHAWDRARHEEGGRSSEVFELYQLARNYEQKAERAARARQPRDPRWG